MASLVALPPAIRLALIRRALGTSIVSSHSQEMRELRVNGGAASANWRSRGPQSVLPQRRQYATVNTQDTDEMWTRHRQQQSTAVDTEHQRKPAETTGNHLGSNHPIQVLDPDTVRKTMALPTQAQYPRAGKGMFNSKPDMAQVAIHTICQQTKRSMQADVDFSVRNDPRTEGRGSAGLLRVCTLRLAIPDICEESAVGEGLNNKTARQAAYLHVLAKLHAKGALERLFEPGPKSNAKPQPWQPLAGQREVTKREAAEVSPREPMQDVQHWRKVMTIPTRQQYPGAVEAVFEPSLIAGAIDSQAGRMKLSMNTDIDYSTRKQAKVPPIHVCNLKLDIPDMCQETGVGEGFTKQTAKHAAWLHVIAKMHESGVLKELFPDPGADPVYVDEAGAKVKPVNVDKQLMDEQKDAKTEIYNYAAAFGQVPQFHVQLVQPRAARPSYRRQPKKVKPMTRVTISIPELKLEAVGAGDNLRSAETAAAVLFKRAAEEQHKADPYLQSANGSVEPSMLNTDTAKDFFTFLKELRRHLNVEVENEQIMEAGMQRHTARLTVDGEPTGQTVSMSLKKQATSIAHLTAAIEITKTEPTLLSQFQQRMKIGKGKVLQPVNAIDFHVDLSSLRVMREALVEARQAGLPDTQELLSAAEESLADEVPRRRRRQLSSSQVADASRRLTERQTAFEQNPALEELRLKKASLPMNQYRAQVLDMVSNNAYSIVVGATGSGKTTQVPQIILEDLIASGRGGECNIICTQPRRIAATSVAQRVAIERNEPMQQSVGYHVRFDAKLPQPGGSITYCTTGILLEQLKHDPDMLDSASHLIIDEVHERDLNIDFLMIVVKKALQARRAASKTVPKVVLMSATLDTELFASYFAYKGLFDEHRPCPSISVPGRTFPVKDKYLGDIMHELLQSQGTELNRVLDMDLGSQDYLKSETQFSARRGLAVAPDQEDFIIDWKRERPTQHVSEDESTAEQEKEEALVPTALLAATIAHICKTTQDGAILAFMPGIEEILATQRHLLERDIAGLNFRDASKFKVCLLHSTIPKEEQSEIFEPVAPGCRKIILSTNIAETSVTVTDVKYVVDTGKLRETRYDQVRRITKLQCVWESKSNSKQRAGRAGRVQNGYYYALFSKERHDSLRAVGLPELLRSDLQETCLSIKAQRFDQPVAEFLGEAIEPPPPRAIQAALSGLTAIEAFTEDEQLTDLGRLLSRLPVHPTLGKMIVLGVIFRCLDPMLVFGAAAGERSLFVSPIGGEARAAATSSRRSYARGETSDHLATLQAFLEIRNLRDQYGMRAAFDRARESFIHMGAFRNIDQTAKQIIEILTGSGLIPNGYQDGPRESEYGPASLNRNSGNSALVQSLLLAGVYPNLGAKVTSKGSSYRTGTEQGVIMHPSSLNDDSKRKPPQEKHKYGTLFAYSALARSNGGGSLFMRDTTIVTPLQSALFGGKLSMSTSYRLEMDDWLPFFVQASDRQFATKLVLEFRKALDRVLNSAFRSLANVDAHRQTSFVDDPMREQFASRVVQILDQSANHNHQRRFWSTGQ